jgi:hypothetical protein
MKLFASTYCTFKHCKADEEIYSYLLCAAIYEPKVKLVNSFVLGVIWDRSYLPKSKANIVLFTLQICSSSRKKIDSSQGTTGQDRLKLELSRPPLTQLENIGSLYPFFVYDGNRPLAPILRKRRCSLMCDVYWLAWWWLMFKGIEIPGLHSRMRHWIYRVNNKTWMNQIIIE